MTTFLARQYSYLWQTVPARRSLKHKLYAGVQAVNLLVSYLSLRIALKRPPPSPGPAGKECVVILLSHNRPQNISLLVQAALRNSFVTKVIVSNSNKSVHIKDWVKAKDSRLVLIDETRPTRPGYRFVLASLQTADYFLSVDDDIFLTPRQWAAFFERLVREDSTAHGLTGNFYRPGQKSSNGSPFHHVSETDTEVDVLIGAYAFTRRHLESLFELARQLEMGDLTNLANGEDVLLSFAGSSRPKIHNLGPLFCCASASLEGVALWRTLDDFWNERVKLFERARAAWLALKQRPSHQ